MKYTTLLNILIFTFLYNNSYSQFHGYGCINKMELLSAKGKFKPDTVYNPAVRTFPIMGNYARKNNRTITYPFGVSVHSIYFDQAYTASKLLLKSDSTSIYARADSLYQNTSAYEMKASIRPNIWLFPFLNIYGILGYTKGVISPDLVVPYIVLENVPVFDTLVVDTTFEIHDDIGYVGPTYGAGLTLSIGFRYLFIVADYNYSVTDPTDLDENLHNHFFSPKAGVFLGRNSKLLGAIWVGAMYIRNDQSFQGKIDVSEINPLFVPLFGKEATYSGNITAVQRWNLIFGGSIAINNHHFISIEAGFFERQQIAFSYNFNF